MTFFRSFVQKLNPNSLKCLLTLCLSSSQATICFWWACTMSFSSLNRDKTKKNFQIMYDCGLQLFNIKVARLVLPKIESYVYFTCLYLWVLLWVTGVRVFAFEWYHCQRLRAENKNNNNNNITIIIMLFNIIIFLIYCHHFWLQKIVRKLYGIWFPWGHNTAKSSIMPATKCFSSSQKIWHKIFFTTTSTHNFQRFHMIFSKLNSLDLAPTCI